jgi:hypothetical protein
VLAGTNTRGMTGDPPSWPPAGDAGLPYDLGRIAAAVAAAAGEAAPERARAAACVEDGDGDGDLRAAAPPGGEPAATEACNPAALAADATGGDLPGLDASPTGISCRRERDRGAPSAPRSSPIVSAVARGDGDRRLAPDVAAAAGSCEAAAPRPLRVRLAPTAAGWDSRRGDGDGDSDALRRPMGLALSLRRDRAEPMGLPVAAGPRALTAPDPDPAAPGPAAAFAAAAA